MAYTREQLRAALIAADKAGDTAAAQRIAAQIRQADAGGKDTRPTSQRQGFKDEWAKATANFQRLQRFIPFMGGLNPNGTRNAQAIDNARQRHNATAPTRPGFGGQLAAGTLASLPTMVVPGGPFVQGALSGLLLSNNLSDPKTAATDALIGAGGGKAGELLGKYVVAPVARRAANSRPVRAAIDAFRRDIGRGPSSPPPRLTRPERVIAPEVANIRTNLQDAQRLGLPYALVDADPKLRALGGSAARLSPNAGKLAEQTFEPRAAGQAERAVDAIDTLLAPVTNIEQRAGQIKQSASAAAQPFYNAAYAQAAPVDEQIAAMLQTPAGKSALRNAYDIAANQRKDPLALGFNLNEQGEVVLQRAPSMETLDLVKQGMDMELGKFRNQLTGKLDLEGNKGAQSVNALLADYKARLDQISPDYAQARAVYSENIAPRTALQTGYGILPKTSTPQRQFDAALEGMAPAQLPEAQRGFATAMADQVDKVRLVGNPYKAVYGSPQQQGKVASLFPEGAADFNRVYGLEDDMAKTAQELLGGSPTARRMAADAQFSGGLAGDVGEAAVNAALTGSPTMGLGSFVVNLGRRAAQKTVDRKNLGMLGAQRKAEELAPVLFNTDTPGILAMMDQLAAKQAAQNAQKKAYADLMGRLGLLPGAAAAPLLIPSQ